jgi:hypothetical protein
MLAAELTAQEHIPATGSLVYTEILREAVQFRTTAIKTTAAPPSPHFRSRAWFDRWSQGAPERARTPYPSNWGLTQRSDSDTESIIHCRPTAKSNCKQICSVLERAELRLAVIVIQLIVRWVIRMSSCRQMKPTNMVPGQNKPCGPAKATPCTMPRRRPRSFALAHEVGRAQVAELN